MAGSDQVPKCGSVSGVWPRSAQEGTSKHRSPCSPVSPARTAAHPVPSVSFSESVDTMTSSDGSLSTQTRPRPAAGEEARRVGQLEPHLSVAVLCFTGSGMHRAPDCSATQRTKRPVNGRVRRAAGWGAPACSPEIACRRGRAGGPLLSSRHLPGNPKVSSVPEPFWNQSLAPKPMVCAHSPKRLGLSPQNKNHFPVAENRAILLSLCLLSCRWPPAPWPRAHGELEKSTGCQQPSPRVCLCSPLPGGRRPGAGGRCGTPRASDNPGAVCLLSGEATPKHGRATSPPIHARANAMLLTSSPQNQRFGLCGPGPPHAL